MLQENAISATAFVILDTKCCNAGTAEKAENKSTVTFFSCQGGKNRLDKNLNAKMPSIVLNLNPRKGGK